MDYKRIFRTAESYAKRRGASEGFAEDFASYACEKVYNSRKAPMQYIFADFVRLNKKDLVTEHRTIFKSPSKDEFNELNEVFKVLLPAGETRVIIILFYKWGLTMEEIGDLFGYTESRISQKFKYAIERLRNRSSAKEFQDNENK
jgi:predicted DNA-binding protein YlxM (UPF0122 family)